MRYWRKRRWLWAGVVAALALSLGRAQDEVGRDFAKSFLWEVRKGSGRAFVLGSIHVARPALYPLDPDIMGAFEDSHILAVEVDIEGMDPENARTFLQRGVYTRGDRLGDHVSAETMAAVSNRVSGYGLPLYLVETYRPWFLAQMLSMLELQKLGYDAQWGIDRYFLQLAGQEGKPVLELESFEFQLGLFEGMTAEEQEKFLLYTMVEMDEVEEQAEVLMEGWQEGRVGPVEELLTEALREYPDLADLMERLITKRNERMAAKVIEYMRGGRPVFVVAGAAHLVGEKGILELLEEQGCAVEQK